MAVASIPDINVRNIREEDINNVFNICNNQGDICSLQTDDLVDTLYRHQRMVLVATSKTGAVDGACFQFIVNENFAVISGFVVRPDHPDPNIVLYALYEEVSRRFGRISVEVIVPQSMGAYMTGHHFIKRWHINRYVSWGKNFRLPFCDSVGYIVEELVDSGVPFTLHHTAPNGEENTIDFNFSFRPPFRSFKLYEEDNLKLVGYGVLDRNESGWIIAPLYASDTKHIKILLRKILHCIKRESDFVLVRLYVVNCSVEKHDLLYGAGFHKSPVEWISYCQENDIVLRNWWNYAIFSLCPFLPSYFPSVKYVVNF